MSPKIKRILAGGGILLDLLFLAVFVSLFIDEMEMIYLFLAAFPALSIFTRFDYIKELGSKIRLQNALKAENQMARDKREIAEYYAQQAKQHTAPSPTRTQPTDVSETEDLANALSGGTYNQENPFSVKK